MHLDGGTNIGNGTSHSLLGHHTHSTRLPIVVRACFRACAPLSLSLSSCFFQKTLHKAHFCYANRQRIISDFNFFEELS